MIRIFISRTVLPVVILIVAMLIPIMIPEQAQADKYYKRGRGHGGVYVVPPGHYYPRYKGYYYKPPKYYYPPPGYYYPQPGYYYPPPPPPVIVPPLYPPGFNIIIPFGR